MIPTTCPACGAEYEERTQEGAADPNRRCPTCAQAAIRAYQERVPAPEKRTPGTCRSCGAEIVFLRTRTGSRMPVDAETVEEGEELFDPKRHTSHFATCPQAGEHRRR